MKPIHFEFQEFSNGVTIVALDSKLEDYEFKPVLQNGQIVMQRAERTVKDCRSIDGCIYFHLGVVSDQVM
ncbi:MAG: hypothetical protein K2G13_09520, partial [Muribaculaceae bacterium]|nr:hypothetical protein [Muribaculaceae bacterium]